MEESKMPPPSHPKNAATPTQQYVPPIVPGEPHSKFVPKKLLILVLFFSCIGVITFAFWLSSH